MTIHQTAMTVSLTDLPPAVRAALAAGRRVEVTSGSTRVAVLVPIKPAALSPTAALAAIERLLAEADAAGYGSALRDALSRGDVEHCRP